MRAEKLFETLPLLPELLVSSVTGSIWGYAFLVLIVILLVLFPLLLFYQKRKMKHLNMKVSITRKLFTDKQEGRGLDSSIYTLLEIFHSLIDTAGYYFYLQDGVNNQYVLKAVRARGQEGEIGPSYSGLVPYSGDTYTPPLTLTIKEWGNDPEIIMEGKIPLLQLVFSGRKGLIRLGPLRTIPRGSEANLNFINEVFSYILENNLERSNLKYKVETQSNSAKAMQKLTSITMDFSDTMQMVMNVAINMIGSSGAFFCSEQGKNCNILFISGLEQEIEDLFKQDEQGINKFISLLGEQEFRALNTGDKDFYQVPSYLAATGLELFLLVGVRTASSRGVAVFFYNKLPSIEIHRLTALQMIICRIGDLLDIYNRYHERSDSYIEMLKMLVQTADNLDVYTIGYSELVTRYAEAIAREMNLDKQEIEDIALAAYLSNLGVLGFSTELLFKEGKYSEIEFETMKLHVEVGANIVESTIGNYKVASIIRHHHERMDGNGYPKGLKGQEIPLGSRIIAVIQTFLAKINGRSYREPLTFAKSVELLKSTSGSQLDPQVIESFLHWFAKKQANPQRKGRSLGPCWEMRCSPQAICQKCPAYNNATVNCWDVQGTLCASHGNRCDTCFIYTEYAYRMAPKVQL